MGTNSTEYSAAQFIRASGGISFEERAPQPSDFTKRRNFDYAKEYAESPTEFAKKYPDWQTIADDYVMRRSIITITGKQTCLTSAFQAQELAGFTEPGFVRISDFAIPEVEEKKPATSHTIGGRSARASVYIPFPPSSFPNTAIPNGKYQLVSFNFNDRGDGYTELSATYKQTGEWKLLNIVKKRTE